LSTEDAVRLSKSVSFLLRHGGAKAGLHMRADGYVRLDELVANKQLSRWKPTSVDILALVSKDSKQRFGLWQDMDTGEQWIRANQGHTLAAVADDALLEPITDPATVPVCVHGTYMACLPAIERDGLSRMARNHIHFSVGLPEAGGVISGMRASAEVVIWLDVAKTLAAGIKLFRSANNVVLSPGDGGGRIPPSCFAAVERRRAGGGGAQGGRAGKGGRGAAGGGRGKGRAGGAEGRGGGSVGVGGGGGGAAAAAEATGGVSVDTVPQAQLLAHLRERAAFVQQQSAAGNVPDNQQLRRFLSKLGARVKAGLGTPPPALQAAVVAAFAVIGWDLPASRATAGASAPPTAAAVVGCIHALLSIIQGGGGGAPAAPPPTAAATAAPPEPRRRPYDYYAVLDFEATCVAGPQRLRPQEIIEFPTVLVDGQTLQPVAEFHEYCRPHHHGGQLSPFCVELTGIQQAWVDAARPFAEVLRAHSSWLAGHLERGPGGGGGRKTVAFVTCGDWDLKTMLPAQLALLDGGSGGNGGGGRVPSPFGRWINIKQLDAARHGPKSAGGMPSMLRGLGLRLDGRHHSGIDDCRNIAKILRRLGEDGARLECTWPGGGVGAAGRRRGGGGAAAGAGGADAVQAVSATNFRRLQGR
jgi:RNA:NAD 2'-phosphotransferase (TPT1/KptA family)/inhibitor of KinA sporulation pathway (predicted exonuclease)